MRLKLPSKNIRHNTTVTRIFNGISRFRISPWGIKLCRNAQIPTTTRPLKIFEPTTLLMAISLLPARAALMLTEASGAGAHGHDGQSDDDAGDLQDPRQGGASLHEKVCTFDQKYKSYE